MKKLILFSLAAVILLWIGCSKQADVNSMLEKPESRSQIISGLLSDHERMTELMDSMMSHDHTRTMMKGHKGTMDMMMGDTAMMHNMMGGMMKDGNMMGRMMQMMNKEGMMSGECMQSCMKMMADKGMSMDMGIMKDTSAGTEKEGDNHDAHH